MDSPPDQELNLFWNFYLSKEEEADSLDGGVQQGMKERATRKALRARTPKTEVHFSQSKLSLPNQR